MKMPPRGRRSAFRPIGLTTLWLIVAAGIGTPAKADDTASIASSLPGGGDPGGVRARLAKQGVTYGAIYTGEVLSNLSGGLKRGTVYQGKLETFLGLDLEKLTGWQGLTFFTNNFAIHGSGNIKGDYVGNLATVSNIDAMHTWRLSELWFQQAFWNNKASIRVGQLAADTEFFNSRVFGLFVDSDWPSILGRILPSGGPAYPWATPGIRLKLEPTDQLSMYFAVFNGDPAGAGDGDPERRNPYSLKFPVKDPPFAMAEAQYRYNENDGLAGTLRLGGWHHFGKFSDQRFDANGVSLADPLSSGNARLFRGDSGIYGIFDQQLYRPKGGDAESGITVFSRISAAPTDRNLVDFYADGGIVFAGMVPGRPADKFGGSVIYMHMSDQARALDLDTIANTGQPRPLRDYELAFELTYQAEIVPGWSVQPVLQYIVHPGGHVPDPSDPTGASAIPNAVVFGARTTIRY